MRDPRWQRQVTPAFDRINRGGWNGPPPVAPSRLRIPVLFLGLLAKEVLFGMVGARRTVEIERHKAHPLTK